MNTEPQPHDLLHAHLCADTAKSINIIFLRQGLLDAILNVAGPPP